MKILFLSDDFPPQSFGGAGIVAYNIAKEMHERGHDVLVATSVQERTDEGEIEYNGLKVRRMYSQYHERWRAYLSLYNPQTVHKINEILEEFKPDVVHAHNVHAHLSYHCLRLAKRSEAKVFLTAHDVMSFHYGKLYEFIDKDDLSCSNRPQYRISPFMQMRKYRWRYNPLRNMVIRYYLQYVDTIFAVSNALKDALEQNGINNVTVVHNGIDVEEWKVDQSIVDQFKEQHRLVGKKVVLFGGRLSEAKGGQQAILAMKEVVADTPDAVLLVMGNRNTYAEKIEHAAQSLGIADNLVFTGWISGDQLKAAYASADVVLVPSVCLDSFPTINLEAMAMGKPVVATCFGGSREAVQDGKSGYIVNPLNVSEMAKKISMLLNGEGIQKGRMGYEIVQKHFTLKSQVDKLIAGYLGEDGFAA